MVSDQDSAGPTTSGSDDDAFLAELMRLRAAGIIDSAHHDSRTGRGVVRFTDGYHRLLMAGRRPTAEPDFQAALRTGDPAAVRRWIEHEAFDESRLGATREDSSRGGSEPQSGA